MPQNKPRAHEAGNVFIFILLGVVLFAALAYSVARGMQSETTTKLSNREATIAASEILAYAQRIERAVNHLRRKGTSENDISFDQEIETGYDHSPVQPAEHQVFNTSGGAISWQSPPQRSNDGSEWFFTGETCIPDIGTGSAGCAGDADETNEELIIGLSGLDSDVCSQINNRLNISGIPADGGGGLDTTKFQGDFDNGTEVTLAGGPFNAACFSFGGDNHFYFVLIAR